MCARHREEASGRGPALPVAIVLGLALAAGGGLWVFKAFASDDASASCDAEAVTIAVTPELELPITTAARALAEDENCVRLTVSAERSAQVASGGLGTALTDLWVPDSSAWLGRTAPNMPKPSLLNASLATSPVLLVSANPIPAPSSWLAAIGSGTVAVIDPLTSSAGAAALLSVQAERAVTNATDEQVGGVLVPAAQNYGAQPAPIKDTAAAYAAVTAAGSQVVATATEQSFVSYMSEHPGTPLQAVAPQTGAVRLDYPLASFSEEPAVRAAGDRLWEYLGTDAGKQALAASAFRDANGTELSGGLGAGAIAPLAVPKDPAAITQTLTTWGVLTVPSRLLAVFDVSGSMDAEVGGISRMDLTVAAATRGLAMFSKSAKIGAWAFSDSTLTRSGKPYRDLIAVRGVEEHADGESHRDALRKELAGLPAITQGGTALDDTVLAAYRYMQQTYDPNSVNSVLLLTDGAEDGSSKLSEAETIETLKREYDPAKPVNLIFIGISKDADAAALERLSEAVRGRYYVAENPADIGTVFIQSFLNRAS